jgi:ribosome-associated protein
MKIESLLAVVEKALEDAKAHQIKVLDVRDLTSITDIMVIASGNSNRHVSAIAEQVAGQAKRHGYSPLSEQGRENGEWALVDLGDVVIHVMQPQVREFYQLEKLWRPHAAILEQQWA